MPYTPGRRVLVLTHTGREDAISAALQATRMFAEEGLVTVMLEQDVAAIRAAAGDPPEFAPETLGVDCELEDITLGLVLGGDGSVLRAADFVRGHNVPLLAVNLGHVGFLAESERTDLHRTVQAIASESYVVIERMALDSSCSWRAARWPARGPSTRPPWRSPTGSGCSRWSSPWTTRR